MAQGLGVGETGVGFSTVWLKGLLGRVWFET